MYVCAGAAAAGLAVEADGAGDNQDAITADDVARYGLSAPKADDAASEAVTDRDVARLGLRAPTADDSSPEQYVTQEDVAKYGLKAPRGSRDDGQVRAWPARPSGWPATLSVRRSVGFRV
jgi:hypothetical protein